MFGFVIADQGHLTPEQLERYKGVYCGLCRTIGKRHGQIHRMSLTYDMTFLILLLDSLYEPELQKGEDRCIAHPIKKRHWETSSWADYGADMNVALAYYKCLDDWQDDKNPAKLAAAKVLGSHYSSIKAQWPRQCSAVETCLEELSQLEQSRSGDLDRASRCFGRLMGELLSPLQDRWQQDLQQIGMGLGQFIYLMDAYLDRQEDEKRGRYNPIAVFEENRGSVDMIPVLTMLMGDCTQAFERLPLEQDLELLRNILYSGVWTRFRIWKEKQDQTHSKSRKEEHPK